MFAVFMVECSVFHNETSVNCDINFTTYKTPGCGPFPGQTIMAQSGNAAASEGDVTSLSTGQELNFDDDTLKGKDSYNG